MEDLEKDLNAKIDINGIYYVFFDQMMGYFRDPKLTFQHNICFKVLSNYVWKIDETGDNKLSELYGFLRGIPQLYIRTKLIELFSTFVNVKSLLEMKKWFNLKTEVVTFDDALEHCVIIYLELAILCKEYKSAELMDGIEKLKSVHQKIYGEYWEYSSRFQFYCLYWMCQNKLLNCGNYLHGKIVGCNIERRFDEFYYVDKSLSDLSVVDIVKFRNTEKDRRKLFGRATLTSRSLFEKLFDSTGGDTCKVFEAQKSLFFDLWKKFDLDSTPEIFVLVIFFVIVYKYILKIIFFS